MSESFQERRNPSVSDRRNHSVADRRAPGVGAAASAAAGFVAAAADAALRAAGLAKAKVNPIAEEAYWRANYAAEPYYDKTYSFEDYYHAYRAGWEGRARHAGRSFEEIEGELEQTFNWNRGNSMLSWETARAAARAAWNRAGQAA